MSAGKSMVSAGTRSKNVANRIAASSRWTDSVLLTTLKSNGGVRICTVDDLGAVDFYPNKQLAILYATEAEICAGVSVKRRAVKFRKVPVKGIILAEKSSMDAQYFQEFQKFVVLDLGMPLIPVADQIEAAQLIIHMCLTAKKGGHSNPLLVKRAQESEQESMINSLQCVPKLGMVKAKSLLQYFHNIKEIGNASVEDLSKVISAKDAITVHEFFHKVRSAK